jgi:hypothetical protein
MRNRLFIFGSFAHDPHGVLAAVYQLAFVGIKRGTDFSFRIARYLSTRFELRVAPFANAKCGKIKPHESKRALPHNYSRARPAGRV